MDIITLIQRQKGLEYEAAEMKRRFPLKDKDDAMRYADLRREIEEMEAQICEIAQTIVDDEALDREEVIQEFADAINEAAEKGVPVEDVLLGKDSILELETVSCLFKIAVCEGKRVVLGGELSAQCKKFPWLFIKVTDEGVANVDVWSDGVHSRPILQGTSFHGYHLDGSYQRGVLAFFRREYEHRSTKSRTKGEQI